jgi:hypothetical protein
MGLKDADALLNELDTPKPAAPSPIVTGTLPQTIQQAGGRGYERVNAALAELRRRSGEFLTRGIPPEAETARWLTDVLNPVPGSVPQAAMLAGSEALGGIPIVGRATIPRILAQRTVEGAGLGAAVHGVDAAIRGRDVGESVLQGTGAGSLTGLLRGTGESFAQARLNAQTRAALRGLDYLKSELKVSKPVRDVLDTSDPSKLFSRRTLDEMKSRASKLFQSALDRISGDAHAATGGRAIQYRLANVPEPPPNPAAPDRVGKVRGVNWSPQPGATGRATATNYPTLTNAKSLVEDGQKLIAALREVGEESLARQAELDIMQHLETLQPGLGQRYGVMVRQFANDHGLIRYVEGIQQMTTLRGGVNPADMGATARAEKEFAGGKVDKRAVDAAYNLLLAGSHPTSFYGAGHTVGALRDLTRPLKIDPTKVTLSPGVIRQIVSGFGNVGSRLGAARVGEATAPGPDEPK